MPQRSHHLMPAREDEPDLRGILLGPSVPGVMRVWELDAHMLVHLAEAVPRHNEREEAAAVRRQLGHAVRPHISDATAHRITADLRGVC